MSHWLMQHHVAALFLAVSASIAAAAMPAAAGPVEEAQTYVVQQTGEGQNVLASDCDPLTTKNGKNVCYLEPFAGVVLVGNVNQRKAEAVKEEYQTLTTLDAWNVGVAGVGSAFITPLPCSAADKPKFSCSGFTEEQLSGREVHWASYQGTLIERKKAAACKASSYAATVKKAYQSVSVAGDHTLQTLVSGKSEDWREELSGDVTSMGQFFAQHGSAVIDLQAFIADNGAMKVFDPQGLSSQADFVACWSSALQVFGALIAEQQ
ncbi:hypothetical protein NPA31_004660 [Aurantimonas sp. MSK8Z-1]|uniref:hypothetical protein n=1 Tax=Mangrovibrevibacter kandeliae TaxID=2968473 RepID=UPI0021185970|nr:hypothetical protein [Aurantimonas sp. MSK8Z-1]MCW4114254.1 hypothetical protein [Aurantimonas sp. MSK8Z-1]